MRERPHADGNSAGKTGLDDSMKDAILSRIREDEIVAMCCDVINIPSPTGGELAMAEYMRAAFQQTRLDDHLAAGGGHARQCHRPPRRLRQRPMPHVQWPHGYVQHRRRRFPHRHWLQAARRRQRRHDLRPRHLQHEGRAGVLRARGEGAAGGRNQAGRATSFSARFAARSRRRSGANFRARNIAATARARTTW